MRFILKQVLAYGFNSLVGDKTGTAVRGVNAVQRIFGVRQSFAKTVEHFIVRHELVGGFRGNLVYNGKLFVKNLAHSQLVGRGQKERFQKNNYYPLFF